MESFENNLGVAHVEFLSQTSPVPHASFHGDYANMSSQKFSNKILEMKPFEHNQSYPAFSKNVLAVNPCLKTLEKFNGDDLNSYNYSNHNSSSIDLNASLNSICGSRPHSRISNGPNVLTNTSWNCDKFKYSSLLKNPRKAVVTFDVETSKILTVNKEACRLFGYLPVDFIGMNITSMFDPNSDDQRESILDDVDFNKGNIVIASGKVLEAFGSDGSVIPVSIWMRRVEGYSERPRCITILEPVKRVVANFTFNNEGYITSCDNIFANLHHCTSSNDVIGVNILQLLPHYDIPAAGSKISRPIRVQRTISTTQHGETFPVTVCIKSHEKIKGLDISSEDGNNLNQKSNVLYRASMWIFTSMGGLMTCRPDGAIHSVNTNFSLNLLGLTEEELMSNSIFEVIPSLPEDIQGDRVCDTSIPRSTSRNSHHNSMQAPSPNSRCNKDLFNETPLQDESLEIIENGIGVMSPINKLLMNGSAMLAEMKQPKLKSSDSASSWLEVTLNQEEKADATEEAHSNGMAKINMLLNGSVDLVKAQPKDMNRELLLESSRQINSYDFTKDVKPQNTVTASPDSAVHSATSGQTCKMLKPSDSQLYTKCSPMSSFSDYHSGQDSPKVTTSITGENCSYVVIDSMKNDSSNTCNLEQSLCNDTQGNLTSEYSIISMKDDTDTGDMKNASFNKQEFPQKKKFANKFITQMSTDATSTPLDSGLRRVSRIDKIAHHTQRPLAELEDGCYQGQVKHKHGNFIDVTYHVAQIALEDGSKLFCFWISREINDTIPAIMNLTMQSSLNCSLQSLGLSYSQDLDNSLGALLKKVAEDGNDCMLSNQGQAADMIDESCMDGEVGEKYELVKRVGNGAFGFVQAAKHKLHGQNVIIKFIVKEKILDDCWVDDFESDTKIPMEISLLTKFNHENIVKVLEYFENQNYFCVVMKKHGKSGIDLFEFIDRSPNLDEALACHIFRQIAQAVDHLHRHKILHRDIKDENVIIDEKFCCKLIDFGSATFMQKDKLFSAFCGTVEYCSPEVLLGNKYAGPELEMWSLGVTLYTLVYGENPFQDVNETIEAVLKPPFSLTQSFMGLIYHLLQRDVVSRCTMKELLEHPWMNQEVNADEYAWDDVMTNRNTKKATDFDEDSLKNVDVTDCSEYDTDEESLQLELKKLALKDDDDTVLDKLSSKQGDEKKRSILSPLNGRVVNEKSLNRTF